MLSSERRTPLLYASPGGGPRRSAPKMRDTAGKSQIKDLGGTYSTYSASSRISCNSAGSRRIGLPRMLLEPSAASIKSGKASTPMA